MNEALFSRRDATRRGGFTLVEVVIALAIFLFGAIAIIRIFPPALGLIQNSGDKATALSLNRTALARFAKESSAVPSSVHDTYITADIPGSGPTAVIGSAIRNNSLPKRNLQAVDNLSALGRFKYISGEKQIVRRVFVLVGGVPTPIDYVLTSFPIAGPLVGSAPNQTRPPLAQVYKEIPVSGVVAETRLDNSGATPTRKSGFLNFTEAEPSLASAQLTSANPEDFYYASYKYLDAISGGLTNGIVNATNDEVLRSSTPNGTNPNITISQARLLQGRRFPDSPATGALNQSRVIDGPIQLKFRRQLINPVNNPNVSSDIEVQNTLNNLGVLVLTNVSNGVSPLVEGDEVSVDYQINDWRQIVSNSVPSIIPEVTPTPGPVTVPPTPLQRTPREVVLPLRALSDGGDGTTPSPATFALMSYLATNPATMTKYPTLQANALNVSDTLATPPITAPTEAIANLSANNPFFLWGINRKGGRILFDTNDRFDNTEDYQVFQSRVVYQNLDSWTHQLSVAPSNYTPYYGVGLNNRNTSLQFVGDVGNVSVAEPWRYYVWNAASGSQPGRIFFPPSEAGKTISLSYVYTDAFLKKEVTNDVITINTRWIRAADAPAGATQDLAITDANGDSWLAYAEPQLSGSSALMINAIRSVKGISIQARTAWLDGSNFAQVSTIGFRGDSK